MGTVPACPPALQVAGWEAQKKEQPMFGEEQHVRYGDPRHPLNPPRAPHGPAGVTQSTSCARRVLQASLGAPSACQGPLDTPCVTWVPHSLWTRLVPQGHPRIPTSVDPSVPRTPLVPCVHPMSPMSLPGSHPGVAARGSRVSQAPQNPAQTPLHVPPPHPTSLQGLPGSQSFTSLPAPRRGGAVGAAAPWGGR